jgi:hypothetical protein
MKSFYNVCSDTASCLKNSKQQQLIRSIYKDRMDDLRKFIVDKDAGPNSRTNRERKPALIVALELKNMEAVNILLNSSGINVNLQQLSNYVTPLMIAVSEDENMRLLNRLIGMGANVNMDDIEGNTALFYAAKNFNLNNMNLLLSNGADINKLNKNRLNPLEYILTLYRGKLGSSGFDNEGYLNTIQFLVNRMKQINKDAIFDETLDASPEVVGILNGSIHRHISLVKFTEFDTEGAEGALPSGFVDEHEVDEEGIRLSQFKPFLRPSDLRPSDLTAGKSRRNKKYKNKSKKGKQYKNKNKSKKDKQCKNKNKSIKRK